MLLENRDEFCTGRAPRADEGLQLFPWKIAELPQGSRGWAEKQTSGEREARLRGSANCCFRRLMDSADPDQSLVPLEEALKKYPQEPALVSMLSVVKESLARRRDRTTQGRLPSKRAKDAIRRKAYAEAIEDPGSDAEGDSLQRS